jgi:protein-tyrosine phosphatase
MDPNEYVTSVTEIMPGLFLGNQHSSEDPDILKRVSIVVNCTKHIKFTDSSKINIRIPVNDPGNSDHLRIDALADSDDQKIMLKALIPVIELIAKYRKRGAGVLVHCHAGMQRSAVVVACYLIRYGYWVAPHDLTDRQFRIAKMEKIISLLIKKRPVVFNGGLSINFQPALLRFMKLQ